MKVVFIAPMLNGGGAERVMCTLANSLAKSGTKVVVALTVSEKCEYILDQKILIEINKSTSAVGQILFLRNLIKKHRGASFVSFFTYQNMYTLVAGLGLKQKILVSERSDPSRTLYGRKYLSVFRVLLYQTAYKIVFQTHAAKMYFGKSIQKKSIVIGNPLREDLPPAYHGERKKCFVTYSRLSKEKNIPMMLKAFRLFLDKHKDYTLCIYGQGPEKDNICNIIKELRMESNVEIHPFSLDVHQKVKNAMAFLLASNYEGLSNSMLEAMAIGLPCICTDCPAGGIVEYIKDKENGMLVPVGNAQIMAECMCRLVEDELLLKKISSCAEKIRTQNSTERIVKMWKDIL